MTDYYPYVWENLGKLMGAAMESPQAVDLLWEAKHGRPDDRDGLRACLQLDRLLGGTGEPDGDYAVEFSHNASTYLHLLMSHEEYPADLRQRADTEFPPFGTLPAWSCPDGFCEAAGLLDRLFRDKRVQAKYRSVRDAHTIISAENTSNTKWLYPWQQAISAHLPLTRWHPTTLQPLFPRVASSYCATGRTKAYRVVFRTGPVCIAKCPVLISPGLEILFEMQTLSWDRDQCAFDQFLQSLR